MNFKRSDSIANQTETAGTRIQRAIGGFTNLVTSLLGIRYTAGATAHTLTVMRAADAAKTASDLAAAGTALVVSKALVDGGGNAIAASDVIAVQLDNGTWHLTTVSAWTAGTLTITLAAAIPTGRTAKKGGLVVNYGVAGDAFHATKQFALGSGATTQLPAVDNDGALVRNTKTGAPLVLDVNNATNAGTIVLATFASA